MTQHRGRAWAGHSIEDSCPCPQAPCGLVPDDTADPACAHHSAVLPPRTMRQIHDAAVCPTRYRGTVPAPAKQTVPTPHEPHCSQDGACRCAPTAQCPAVLIDLDGQAHRCTLDPGHEPGHDTGEWGWPDPTNTVHYATYVPLEEL